MTLDDSNKDLAAYLRNRSIEICLDNDCCVAGAGIDVHYCDSYAYITAQGVLLDICQPDYFVGSSHPVAAISLPWEGSSVELVDEVNDQIEEGEHND